MTDLQTRSAPALLGRRAAATAAALLLIALLLQALLSMRLLSATFDETSHLPAGYTYVATGDLRLNPQHPPLVKLLAGLPLLALDPHLDLDDPGWNAEPPDEWGFGYRFLYGNDADRLLFWGRVPTVLLALVLAVYVWRWATDLFGEAAGLAALLLCSFSPTVIAHARFVTFDVPLACFSTATLYHLWRRVRGESGGHLLAAGCALGLALATKFSGTILAAAVVVLLALWALDPQARSGASVVTGLRRAAIALGLAFATAFLVVEAAYLFPLDPGFYLEGLRRVNVDHVTDFPYYMLGEFKPGGWWYYFVVVFLLKTPLPTLILLLAAVGAWRAFPADRRIDEAFLLVPALAYFGVTSALADDIGVRYLLPVYPLVFVFVSRLARALPAAGTPVRVAAAALAVWYVAGTLAIYPDHLAYFNEAVGGPSRGHRLLDDSNVDWGQDVKRLARYAEREKLGTIRVRLGPLAAPDYYGIRALPVSDREWMNPAPGPGVYAFSTHVLIRGELYARQRGVATDWLSRYEPMARIGYSVYLFRFD